MRSGHRGSNRALAALLAETGRAVKRQPSLTAVFFLGVSVAFMLPYQTETLKCASMDALGTPTTAGAAG